jgi:hypothetical protein
MNDKNHEYRHNDVRRDHDRRPMILTMKALLDFVDGQVVEQRPPR